MEGETFTTEDGLVSRARVFGELVVLQLIHFFKVPGQRTLGSIYFERILALGPHHCAADFECSGRAVFEVAQHRGEVFVFNLALGVLGPAATVVAGGAGRKGPLRNRGVLHAHNVNNVSDEELCE